MCASYFETHILIVYCFFSFYYKILRYMYDNLTTLIAVLNSTKLLIQVLMPIFIFRRVIRPVRVITFVWLFVYLHRESAFPHG